MNTEKYIDRFARQLQAKVTAVNKANAEVNRLQPLFVEAFRPFVGKKILTHSGLALKPKAIVESLAPSKQDGYKTPAVYRDTSNYSLRFIVKTCESNGEHTCAYHEACFHVGNIEGYTLNDVLDLDLLPPLRADYTTAEIRQLRKNVDETEKAYREAQNKLSPFGRYDQ